MKFLIPRPLSICGLQLSPVHQDMAPIHCSPYPFIRKSIWSDVKYLVAGALFGVPSDILIQPHFHSQGAMPFCSGWDVLGVCQFVDQGRCKNCVDGLIELTFKGSMKFSKKYFNPPKSLSLCIGLLRNFFKIFQPHINFIAPKNQLVCP